MPIVEAAGGTGLTKEERSQRGVVMQEAMAGAIKQIEIEAAAIWAREDITVEEKNERIAAISNPEEQKRRMFEARAVAKRGFAIEDAERSAEA